MNPVVIFPPFDGAATHTDDAVLGVEGGLIGRAGVLAAAIRMMQQAGWWLNSPVHRGILLDSINTVVGIGLYKPAQASTTFTSTFTTYYSFNFGKPAQ